jgi:uncharacterized protein (TIGR03435 family)
MQRLSPVLTCVLTCASLFGQSFEVASIRVVEPGKQVWPAMRGGPGTTDPVQITFSSVPLTNVILRAYNVKPYQLTGPSWLSSERYDISAKVPAGATQEEYRRMLQNLLAERFGLALHRESRILSGYELVVATGGAKLKPSSGPGSSSPLQPGPASIPKRDANGFPVLDAAGMEMMEGLQGKAVVSFLTARAQPVSQLADRLSSEFRMPILDKTGLIGKFDFTLEFAPESPGAVPTSAALDDSAPNLITAVQHQLGLKLNPGKIRTEILIVDRANRIPTDN